MKDLLCGAHCGAMDKGRHESAQKARRALAARGHELMRTLGYEVQPLAGPVSVLLAGPRKIGIAAFLDRTESPDLVSTRFSGVSSASYALSRAGDEGLNWVIVAAGEMLRLYPVRPGIGVRRRGRTETFVELHEGLLPDLQAALLWDLFPAEALSPLGALETLLDESARYGSNLGTRLSERIYEYVIPSLALTLAKAQKLNAPTQQQLADTYQMALTVLFRLLFVAYAEDRDLLPYKTNDLSCCGQGKTATPVEPAAPMAPRPWDGRIRETRAGVCWCREPLGGRAPSVARLLTRGVILVRRRTPGFNGHRRARPPPGRDPRPDHAYDSRAPGLPACRARRNRPIDGRDPPEAAALLRADDVPVPSATPPAPTWDRADAAAPPTPCQEDPTTRLAPDHPPAPIHPSRRSRPPVSGRGAVTRARAPGRRHRLAVSTVWGDRTAPRDSRAPSPRAWFPPSRALRRRVCAWRHRGPASGAGEPRPFPAQATGGGVAASRGQRLRRWALSPRWRAGAPTPAPCSVTRRMAARVHSSP